MTKYATTDEKNLHIMQELIAENKKTFQKWKKIPKNGYVLPISRLIYFAICLFFVD
jgi:hypothetical protein